MGVHLPCVPEKHRGWRDSEEKVKGETGRGKYGETVLLGDYSAEDLGGSAFLPGNTDCPSMGGSKKPFLR